MYNLTPETLFQELRKTVIGQDEYLRVLSNAAWMHNLRYQHYKQTGEAIDKPKQNLLCIGPSGSGKTLAVEQLGKILNLPVIIENASTLRGEGWRGKNVSSIITRCIDSAPNQSESEAIHCIVCLDEIDKVFKSRLDDTSFLPTDNLLTFIAGSMVTYEGRNRSCMMDTSSLLIICLGAFEGLEDIIKERLSGKTSIGFSTGKPKELPQENLLNYVTEDDLHKYGIGHEFLGRLSLITHTNPLTITDFKRILSQSDASSVYQYDTLLYNTSGLHVDITDEAISCIANEAISTKEGARLLTRRVTGLIQPVLYEVAGDVNADSIVIDCADGKDLCVYSTNLGRDELWEDICDPEYDQQVLESVPLSCIRGRNEIVAYAKEIKDASTRKILLSEDETIAAVYFLAAAIARQLMENDGKGMVMAHVDQMLDTLQTGIKNNSFHPLADMSREFMTKAEKRVPDLRTMVSDIKQMLLDYCTIWLNNNQKAEL